MEIGVASSLPTYAGGLGVLAGDTIRSAADLEVPMVAVTLLYRQGYFHQRLDGSGAQFEEPVVWSVNDFLEPMEPRGAVEIEGRTVHLRAWRYQVKGLHGGVVPVYFLDTDLPENTAWDRSLTAVLYGDDMPYRLCQEVILGIGGVTMLRALGYESIRRFHMNEGHASLLTLALLDEQAHQAGRQTYTEADIESVRSQCVFTTHTPVPSGHDQFPMDLVHRVLRHPEIGARPDLFCCGDVLNMTYLALNLSHYVNGVAKRHGEVSRLMFAPYVIDAITNGVHVATWTAPPMQALFDRHIPDWRADNFNLRYALNMPQAEIWTAHLECKRQLLQYVNRTTNVGMDMDVLTLGFARRATPYKRADLLFRDVERLTSIATHAGPVQVVYAGKAHPRDWGGKEIIRRLFQVKEQLKPTVKVAYLDNYDMALGQLLTAGVDVWLNTPEPPFEASGTSGMKAALNGVPSLSILDGWWIEGHIEGVTGWAIGERAQPGTADQDRSARDATALYDKLEQVVLPLFYQEQPRFLDMMRHAIALNGSFFNTQRMMQEYVLKAYFL
jgi:starch phosphorylase